MTTPITASSLAVLALFVGSGAAALVYEIVWQQMLQLIIGSSTVSVGVLLATFMGGMGLGSAMAPRLVFRAWHPLRAYALVEGAIGAAGLLLLWGMPLVETVYRALGGQGVRGVVMRAIVSAVCLLPATALMGATLPVISRWVAATRTGYARLGLFYAGNIAGAVAGSLIAGFYLLRVHDMHVATYAAVGTNAVVAGVAWLLAARAPYDPPAADARSTGGGAAAVPARDPAPSRADGIDWVIGLSGFAALAAEVVWTRNLALLFGATAYTFSIVLAVFLAALGVGSAVGAAVSRRISRPAAALAWCQALSAPAIAWTALLLYDYLPYWPNDVSLGAWKTMSVALGRTLIAIAPGPLLWGASFPLALAAAGEHRQDPGRVVGRLYAINTCGAIAGALAASLWFVSGFGSSGTQRLLVLVAALSAGLAWLASRTGQAGSARSGAAFIGRRALVLVPAAAVCAAVVPSLPAVLVGHGRHAAAWNGHMGDVLFVGEGLHASVAVSRDASGVLSYHNAGKVQASSQPADMRLQRMLGHLTTVLPRQPRKVLVIGCGAGVTAGAVSVNPMVEEIVIVDIEPLVPKVAKEYFGPVNHDVLKNPKVRVVADDARHFLMTTTETFDAITSDPLDPWVKGAATLYTREFFENAKARLNPGGVVTLFVQLYESSYGAVQSEMATFFEAFPEGLLFGNTFEGQAIDTVLAGQVEPFEIYPDYVDEALRQSAFKPVADSLSQINFSGAVDLFGNYAGRARDLQPWLQGAEINRDRNLRLQYLAALGINLHEGNTIYGDILQYRTFPEEVFIASESTLWRLRQAMEGVRE